MRDYKKYQDKLDYINKQTNNAYKDFKLVEFDDSSILLPPKTIQYGPFDTESELDVYIVIDDIRYRVSKCSIRNNVYVQGLDSRFLVKHYKVNKKP